jgi:hypothetical protein
MIPNKDLSFSLPPPTPPHPPHLSLSLSLASLSDLSVPTSAPPVTTSSSRLRTLPPQRNATIHTIHIGRGFCSHRGCFHRGHLGRRGGGGQGRRGASLCGSIRPLLGLEPPKSGGGRPLFGASAPKWARPAHTRVLVFGASAPKWARPAHTRVLDRESCLLAVAVDTSMSTSDVYFCSGSRG